MDIKNLKEHLIQNLDYIEELLEKYFFQVKFYDGSNQWRFAFTEEDNPNSVRLSSVDLSYKNYKYNEQGDIFTLFMKRLHLNLGKCLNLFVTKSCFVGCDYSKREVYGNFFKKINKSIENELTFYKGNEIEQYPEVVSKFFLSEGITIEAQNKFNIRLDYSSNRIVIPVYLKSKLVGAIGRFNSQVTNNIPKYLPILPYHKSKVLFGYDVNYANIYNNIVILVESEKTVIKAFGMGHRNLLALGGNNVTHFHKNLLYSLNPEEIILILDKGLGKERAEELNINVDKYMEEVIIKEAEKLVSKNVFIKPKVSYINMNDFEEIEDKENLFESEDINLQKYLDKRVIM